MKKQYIKNPIPAEISEDGGASILFVNKQTVPLDGAISEALAGNYCTGQKTLIRNFFFGLMQSMADGVRRDGHARQIANFLTVYPVFKGEIDMDRGYNPDVNGVMIRARLLNEMDLDITDWSFEDVTPGKRSFKLDSVKAGVVMGEYRVGETGNLNGKNLPSTEAGEELRVHWEVEGTDKSGDIPAAKLSSDVGRADIAADALAELASEEYDGKTVVFTVRGNFSSAKISATLKYAAPEPLFEDAEIDLKVTSVTGADGGKPKSGALWQMHGEGLCRPSDTTGGFSSVSAKIDNKSEEHEITPEVVTTRLNTFSGDFGELALGEHVAHITMSTCKMGGAPSKTGTFDVMFVAE